jgi:hypothetical protein
MVMFFAYYILSEGKVSEIIEIFNRPDFSDKENIRRIKFDYNGDETILVNETVNVYVINGNEYELTKQVNYDDIEEIEDFDRVIDDQKALCKQLKKKVKSCKTLEDIVNAFFDVISTAEENPEETIEFEAGTYPYSFDMHNPECSFSLMRSTPDEEDEFYQLELTVSFDVKNEKIPYDCIIGDDDDFRSQVFNSKAYKAFVDKKITNVSVEVYET